MNNKLLVIGAGIGQVTIVKKAKKLGYHVTVVTIPGDWPAIPLADDVWYIDIYDRDQIVQKAEKEGITAVISDQNDLVMPTVAYVSEKLGIPGNTCEQVISYCNKNRFRDNCDLLGIPVPKHISVNSMDFNASFFDCPLPWIVKPADSQSSIGVKRVDTFGELKNALRSALDYSKTHSAILEEFFLGRELVCEGYVDGGKYFNLGFADRKYFNLEKLMIPSQTLFPSAVSENIKNKVIECEKKMAAYVKPAFGITHSEYLYDEKTEEIRVVESALRGGGVFISSHLVPYSTGIDINDVILKKAIGINVDINAVFERKRMSAAGYVCFYLKDGTIHSIRGLEQINNMPYVKMVSFSGIEIGKKTTYKGARKGPILVCADSRKELEQNILAVQNTLKIDVYSENGVIPGIVWC